MVASGRRSVAGQIHIVAIEQDAPFAIGQASLQRCAAIGVAVARIGGPQFAGLVGFVEVHQQGLLDAIGSAAPAAATASATVPPTIIHCPFSKNVKPGMTSGCL